MLTGNLGFNVNNFKIIIRYRHHFDWQLIKEIMLMMSYWLMMEKLQKLSQIPPVKDSNRSLIYRTVSTDFKLVYDIGIA